MNKIQGYLLAMDSESDRGQATKKILVEKESIIQLLKKKLKIPSTQLIQAYELTVLEREKELFSQELNDSKAKLLKISKEQSQCKKKRSFLIAKIDVLNENQLILEKEREEKEKNKQVETSQSRTKAIVQAM